MRKQLYQIGDYVKYGGDYSTLNETKREKGFAKILNIKKFNHYWSVHIELIESKNKVYCIIDKIKPIDLSEKHLKEIGFNKEIDNKGNHAFVMNDVVISSLVYNIIHEYSKSVFVSGFCVTDFRNNESINFEKYKEDNFINVEKFYSDFKSVNNVNDLINYLEFEKGIDINKEKIISLI